MWKPIIDLYLADSSSVHKGESSSSGWYPSLLMSLNPYQKELQISE
jgi:hypothetical protein